MPSLEIDKRTGLVKVPKYPCIAGRGLCQIRATDNPAFDCAKKGQSTCPFRVMVKSK